ncbi:MAG TPA: L,D-transpeptidase family protein [Allosphingosinicella sp.]|nr:L,D-transpeptidase family protein [Allosphingosinicella sp.]
MSAAMLPLAAAAAPGFAAAQYAPALQAVLRASPEPGVSSFYASNAYRPIWVRGGSVSPDAERLVRIIRDADLDGMQSAQELAERLQRSLERARSGNDRDLAEAEAALSSAWVRYVRTLHRPVDVGMIYADPSLSPSTPSEEAILSAAAAAPSLARHLETVSEINPIYRDLRKALAALRDSGARDPAAEQRLKINLDRARVLPGSLKGKYILVDAASQRLWMYEDGQERGSMRVVVGKPDEQTPMLAGLVETAVLNPYWNVPPDLVQKKIAPSVLQQGVGYLKAKGYEVLSDWFADATQLDPKDVDWAAVAAGREEVRVRQLPGGENAMGDVKFMFPNRHGIYLHDTPERALFSKTQRTFSSGCVRLEDADRLAAWLFGNAPRAESSAPEQTVALPTPVPVFITYLTASSEGGKLALRRDPYGLDSVQGRSSTQMAALP